MTKLGHQVSRAREMGSYHLGDLIGRGGMGEVYVATHRMLARKGGHQADPALEYRAGRRRNDPARHRTVPARGRGRGEPAESAHGGALRFRDHPEGALYIVMEYLEGMDLETLIRKEGAQPWQRVVSIMRQACESLAEAHARGLVHRDIKPANLHIGRSVSRTIS
jgi:serine/threonine-protein kinase